jgi:CheY-like chemotaxis protein
MTASDVGHRVTAARDTRGEAILVVEDDQLVATVVLKQLEHLGYRVTLAVDGAQALEKLAADAGIELLFTDITMPGGMDGHELAEAARRQRPNLKVVLTSGYSRAIMAGTMDPRFPLLREPYRKADLHQVLRQALDPAAV